MDFNDRIAVLHKFLEGEYSEEDIENAAEREDTFEFANGERFLVLDDYEADNYARCYLEDLIDDIGFEGINGWKDFLDDDSVENYMEEYNRNYVNDFDIEELEEEMESYGLSLEDFEDEDAFREAAVEEFMGENPISWLFDNYDEKTIKDMIDGGYIRMDMQGLIDYIIRLDGRGNTISSYDGEENEVEFDGETYFVYRQ